MPFLQFQENKLAKGIEPGSAKKDTQNTDRLDTGVKEGLSLPTYKRKLREEVKNAKRPVYWEIIGGGKYSFLGDLTFSEATSATFIVVESFKSNELLPGSPGQERRLFDSAWLLAITCSVNKNSSNYTLKRAKLSPCRRYTPGRLIGDYDPHEALSNYSTPH